MKGSGGMKSESYKSMSMYFTDTKKRSTTIKALHDVLPLIMYIFYPIQLIMLGVTEGFGSEVFLRFTLIPLGTLILVTVLRLIINAKRPYETMDYTPAVEKKTVGKSFPSRHTVSAFIIAMAFLYIRPEIGAIMLILAAAIGVIRVLSGVHYIRDVVGGAIIGIGIGILGFFVF